ncbi:MAG: hypothetical protein NTY37_04385 [Methanothrix sp.]|nr:hypothetical protein [Methanothrix sp.]
MIAKTIFSALERQDLSALYEIRELVERLISERARVDDLPANREVLKVHTSGSTTYRLEKVSCGKNCKGCPHGPYWYGYWRENGKTRSKYIGKNLLSTETKKGAVV